MQPTDHCTEINQLLTCSQTDGTTFNFEAVSKLDQVIQDSKERSQKFGQQIVPNAASTREKPPPKQLKELIKSQNPTFCTSFHLPTNYDMKIDAIQQNAPGDSKYVPPSSFSFREETQEKFLDGQFKTKFHIINNQSLRSKTAKSQEGFLDGPSASSLSGRGFNPKLHGKLDFILQVPHSCTKGGNLNLRLQTTQDQEGIWDGGKRINEHKYREEAKGKHFETYFKPSGTGTAAVDIGSRQRPPLLIEELTPRK